jgi:hypothetical protein
MGQEDLLDGQNKGFDQMDRLGDLENQNLAADGAPDLIPQNIPEANAQDNVTVNPSPSVFSSSENNDSTIPDLNQLPPEAEGDFQFPDVLLPAAQVNQHGPLGPADPPFQRQDFWGPEIHMEELMNDEDIAAQALANLAPQALMDPPFPANHHNLNINVGLVRLMGSAFPDPGLAESLTAKAQPTKYSADLYRLWAKNFSPVGNPDLVVKIPSNWAPFFLITLMTPGHFDWAKDFLTSHSWKALVDCCSSEENMPFALPPTCPEEDLIPCLAEEPAPLHLGQETGIEEETENDIFSLNEKAFRCSPRIRGHNGGFKQASCPSKNCFACSSKPPALSLSPLQHIEETVCKIPTGKLTEQVLRSKSKTLRPSVIRRAPPLLPRGRSRRRSQRTNPMMMMMIVGFKTVSAPISVFSSLSCRMMILMDSLGLFWLIPFLNSSGLLLCCLSLSLELVFKLLAM